MKKIFIQPVLIILVVLIAGCEKTGYMVTISTDRIRYYDLQQIEGMLEDKNFRKVVWEKKKDIPEYPGEVYTVFKKNLTDKPFHIVHVWLSYVKDVPNDIAHNLRIDVSNVYKGMTIGMTHKYRYIFFQA